MGHGLDHLPGVRCDVGELRRVVVHPLRVVRWCRVRARPPSPPCTRAVHGLVYVRAHVAEHVGIGAHSLSSVRRTGLRASSDTGDRAPAWSPGHPASFAEGSSRASACATSRSSSCGGRCARAGIRPRGRRRAGGRTLPGGLARCHVRYRPASARHHRPLRWCTTGPGTFPAHCPHRGPYRSQGSSHGDRQRVSGRAGHAVSTVLDGYCAVHGPRLSHAAGVTTPRARRSSDAGDVHTSTPLR
jgi:hypothetical protein